MRRAGRIEKLAAAALARAHAKPPKVDPYQVAVGPIHAGVIESGHFRFHLVGDRILHLDARLFYKHRGLERAAEGALAEEAMAHVGRACAGCAVANAVAYAHACEQAMGLTPTGALARARTILLELERYVSGPDYRITWEVMPGKDE